MELTIRGKYINDNNCKYNTKCKQLCPFHDIIKCNILELAKLQKLVSFIGDHLPEMRPIFWQSFDELSSWRTLKLVNLSFHIVWLLIALTNWIEMGQDSEYDPSKIGKLQMEMLNDSDDQKFSVKHILETHLKSFITNHHWCQCEYKINITKTSFDKLNIGNRIDLIEKFLSMDGMMVYNDFNSHLKETADLIKENLKKVKCELGNKRILEDVPKSTWSAIFEKYSANNKKPIYLNSDNHLVNFSPCDEDNSDSDEEGNRRKTRYVYVHFNETNPSTLHQISFVGQTFCILCDAKKEGLTIPKMKICNGDSLKLKSVSTGPHICEKICNALVYYYNLNVLKTSSKETYQLNFKNFRYAKNRILAFYTGCSDEKSNLSMLDDADAKKYIILKFLYLLMVK
jgi:hypothetical protein